MLARRRRADRELLRDQDATDAVAHEVAVDLLREVRARVLEVVEDLQPLVAGERLHHVDVDHVR